MSLSLPTPFSRTTRAARQQRARLRAELDSYRTPSERAELDAILSRHSAEDLEQLAAATGRAWAA